MTRCSQTQGFCPPPLGPSSALLDSFLPGRSFRSGYGAPYQLCMYAVVTYSFHISCLPLAQLFNKEINPYLNDAEFDAILAEFKADYNQTHFVRSSEFKEAADKIQGSARQIFVEFLERSCTAEFSGFLLYKELGRRLKVRLLLGDA